ncbi:hypothetical protein [Bradyrhizobium genosp. L]|nr:hypothetical protein [Bradyrhizobium genosp. L]
MTKFAASVGSDLAIIMAVALVSTIARAMAPGVVDFLFLIADFQ